MKGEYITSPRLGKVKHGVVASKPGPSSPAWETGSIFRSLFSPAFTRDANIFQALPDWSGGVGEVNGFK
jgi:hypothetical protein